MCNRPAGSCRTRVRAESTDSRRGADRGWAGTGWTGLLGLADVDTATTPASKGCAAVYAANPAAATNATQKLLTLNTTSLPINDLRELTCGSSSARQRRARCR